MTNTNYGSIYTNTKVYDRDNEKVDDKEHLTYPTLCSVTVWDQFPAVPYEASHA